MRIETKLQCDAAGDMTFLLTDDEAASLGITKGGDVIWSGVDGRSAKFSIAGKMFVLRKRVNPPE